MLWMPGESPVLWLLDAFLYFSFWDIQMHSNENVKFWWHPWSGWFLFQSAFNNYFCGALNAYLVACLWSQTIHLFRQQGIWVLQWLLMADLCMDVHCSQVHHSVDVSQRFCCCGCFLHVVNGILFSCVCFFHCILKHADILLCHRSQTARNLSSGIAKFWHLLEIRRELGLKQFHVLINWAGCSKTQTKRVSKAS